MDMPFYPRVLVASKVVPSLRQLRPPPPKCVQTLGPAAPPKFVKTYEIIYL